MTSEFIWNHMDPKDQLVDPVVKAKMAKYSWKDVAEET
jgi:hypothetical protein